MGKSRRGFRDGLESSFGYSGASYVSDASYVSGANGFGGSRGVPESFDNSGSGAPLLCIDPLHPQPELLCLAADVARRGGVLILPTDTVYGIAVAVPDAAVPATMPDAAAPDPVSAMAAPPAANSRLDILYRLKGRNADKPIPWLVSGAEALAEYMDGVRCAGGAMPDAVYRLAQAHWPGALTLVVPAAGNLPPGFMAADGSIALRAPDNAIVQGILAELGRPLATSSANLQGMPPPSSIQALDPRLAQGVGLIIDGGTVAGGLPSTIVSCLGPRPVLLREGAIPAAALMLD